MFWVILPNLAKLPGWLGGALWTHFTEHINDLYQFSVGVNMHATDLRQMTVLHQKFMFISLLNSMRGYSRRFNCLLKSIF